MKVKKIIFFSIMFAKILHAGKLLDISPETAKKWDQASIQVNDITKIESFMAREKLTLPMAFFFLNEENPEFNNICDIILNCGIKDGYDLGYILYHASEFGRIKIIKKLIDLKVSLDQQDDCGDTALIYAVTNNQYIAVFFLLVWGASTDKINKSGQTFYDYVKDKPKILQMVKEYRKLIAKKFENTEIYPVLANGISEYI